MQKLMLVLVAVAGCVLAAPSLGQEEATQELNQATMALLGVCQDENATIEDFRRVLNNGDVNVRARGEDDWTPLMHAASRNPRPEVITALISAGADVNARDHFGGTALMSAAVGNPNPEIFTTLIKAGADVTARDEDGWTPLMFAAGNPNPEV
ncbi:MAG: ankyrin repeat domain-containing protein, partial [Phycisphaerales bacterium]|nr:ankyrin repeat domain-containing protein [Phycisphaerales bacterium]